MRRLLLLVCVIWFVVSGKIIDLMVDVFVLVCVLVIFGVGGMGKMLIVVVLVECLVFEFWDGVCFVDLFGVDDVCEFVCVVVVVLGLCRIGDEVVDNVEF